jgi:hypothetical protein
MGEGLGVRALGEVSMISLNHGPAERDGFKGRKRAQRAQRYDEFVERRPGSAGPQARQIIAQGKALGCVPTKISSPEGAAEARYRSRLDRPTSRALHFRASSCSQIRSTRRPALRNVRVAIRGHLAAGTFATFRQEFIRRYKPTAKVLAARAAYHLAKAG